MESSELKDKLEGVSWEKYKDESLNYMHDEAGTLLDSTISAFREMTKTSYTALAILLVMSGYGFSHIDFDWKDENIPYVSLLAGTAVCLWFIYQNLMPNSLYKPGLLPENLINSDYEKSQSQLRDQKIGKIRSLNFSIKQNLRLNKDRSDNFKNFVNVLMTTIIAFGILLVIF